MTTEATGPLGSVAKTVTNDTEVLVATASDKKTRCIGLMITAQAVAQFRVLSGAVDEHIPLVALAANGQYSLPLDANGWFDTAAGAALKLTATGAVTAVLRYQTIV